MIDRIIEIRKDNNLSQEKFAERLGLSKNFINQLENGKKNPSNRTILDICHKFNVNEDWLKTGNGNKYNLPIDEDMIFIESLMTDKNNPLYNLIMKTLRTYNALDDTNKKVIKSFAQSLMMQEKSDTSGLTPAEFTKNTLR